MLDLCASALKFLCGFTLKYMPKFNIKPTNSQIKTYYAEMDRLASLGVTKETSVRAPFQNLLEQCGRQLNLTEILEYPMKGRGTNRIFIDAALVNNYNMPHGYCESKDIHDNLLAEVKRKLERGYPRDNIIFQTPERAILLQNDWQLEADLTDPTQLVNILQAFFDYRPQAYDEWEEAVAQFKDVVPEIGNGLAEIIAKEWETNREFTAAFANFHEKCRQSINPNLSQAAVEEMLIQHLLTVRLFRTVFNNPDFTHRNLIAREIETVINALTSHSFSRDDFLESLDRFYVAIERAAAMMKDYAQKQSFLNTVYEQFFQGFSIKVADTHGVVYTPQPIVDFMVKSVVEILKTEFGRSLSDPNIHILDPFVGTGNFIVRIIQEIDKTMLGHKYSHELHCNEIMLLPYYIASMNIEHAFFEAMGIYERFKGNCLANSFELAEDRQFLLFTPENTERVQRQKKTDMFVVIGNPPYNAKQADESDNNKNQKYKTLDQRVKDTYSKDSKARNTNALSDPYVKAIRLASDRIGDEGIVAFVTNNSFLEGLAFDGMREHLAADFDEIYILDLGGNVRKNPKLSGTTHNVFGIQVGVSINFFIRRRERDNSLSEIFYARVDEFWRKEEKYRYLNSKEHYGNIEWQRITPDKRYTWLTEGLHPEFETFTPIGTQEARNTKGDVENVIFKIYSNGAKTNRDVWAYNFNRSTLAENMGRMIETYNEQVFKWERQANREANVDNFVVYDDRKIKWSRDLKLDLKRGKIAEYTEYKVRNSLYRPFTKSNLFFDRIMTEEVYSCPVIFPTPETETENRVICVSGLGSNKPFQTLMTGIIPESQILEKTQCFPFYTYDEDGTNRRENITDWALTQFRGHYQDEAITKRDIFHYVYALLNHPDYRERYQANLKRDLPHLPYTPDFWGFAKAGERLGEIHINYEDAEEYPLRFIETPDIQLNWRVEKMKLSKDGAQITYNDFLTLDGIPAKALKYKLGNRSALEWIIDQYRIKTDKRSGITNNPNRPDDPQYIIKLIKKVITISLETVKIIEELPELGTPK